MLYDDAVDLMAVYNEKWLKVTERMANKLKIIQALRFARKLKITQFV